MFAWRALGSDPAARPGACLTVPALRTSGIGVAFSTRLGGGSDHPFESLNLSFLSGDAAERVRANRARLLAALGCDAGAWTGGRQVHGAAVRRVTATERGAGAAEPGTAIAETDALWTDLPGAALAVLSADCLPLLLADPARRLIGVGHVGWRGLLAGVPGALAAALGEPERLRAYLGPAIGPCCYEVGDDVARAAEAALGSAAVRPGSRLDLWGGAMEALRRAGVREIWPSGLCTRCEPWRFFSHRAGDAGRQGLVAVLE